VSFFFFKKRKVINDQKKNVECFIYIYKKKH
ncbi:LOW QUALITY PROTEIN: hypothetical protein TorRG33x02_239330, partial [Trema orientale]